MTMTQRDAQALTYLAGRIREETKGATKWDEHGTYAVVAKLVGRNLVTSIEQVVRHAADFEAKTPGAINRPFLPEPVKASNGPPKRDEQCPRCGGFKNNCACRHESRAWDDEQVQPMPKADALKVARAALSQREGE